MVTTRPRRRRAHHDNDGAWGHVLAPVWTDHAEQVAALLAKLGDPMREALGAVTGTEFVAAAWAVPNPGRTRFLSDLRVPAARRPSPTTEESVGDAALHRMRRWNDEQLARALRFLLAPLLHPSLVDIGHADPDPELVHHLAEDLVAEALEQTTSAPLLTASLVAYMSEPGGAALLAALLRRGPLPGTAADRFLTATVAEKLTALLTGLPWEIVGPATTETAATATIVEPGVYAEHAVEALRAFETARAVVEDALTRLDRKLPPDVSSVVLALGEARRRYDDVHTLTTAAAVAGGVDDPAEDTDLDTLAQTYAAAEAMTNPARLLTARLRQLELPEEITGCRHPLHELCARADDGDEAAQRDTARLVELADARAAGAGITELHTLDAALRPDLPSTLHPLLLGLMLGSVTVPTADTIVPVQRTGPAPATPTAMPATTTDAARADVDDAQAATATTSTADDPAGTAEETAPVTASATDSVTAMQAHEPDAAQDAAEAIPAEPAPALSAHPSSGPAGSAAPQDAAASHVDDVAAAAGTYSATASSGVRTEDAPGDTTGESDGATIREVAAGSEYDLSSEPEERDDAAEDDAVLSLVHTAIAGHDTGLGFWLAHAGGHTTTAEALRATTLSEAVRSGHGPLADAAVSALETVDPDLLSRDRLGQLAMTAAALRTAIVTGSPEAGNVLEVATIYLGDKVGLASLADAVATAAKRGALAGGQLRVLRSTSAIDDEVATLREHARTEQIRPRTAVFARATEMGQQLFAASGTIGTLLGAVADDDRSRVETVAAEADRLNDLIEMRRLIDGLDRGLRGGGSSARPLQGKAQKKVIEWITAALNIVTAWVRLVRSLQHGAGQHVPADLRALREAATSYLPAAREELAELTRRGGANAAGAALLTAAVDDTQHLLDGKMLPGHDSGCTATAVLGRALLRCPSIVLDTQLRPADDTAVTVEALTAAFGTSWQEIVDARIRNGDFSTARHAVAVAVAGDVVENGRLSAHLDAALAAQRAGIVADRDSLADTLRRAVRLGQLRDEDNITLTRALEQADPDSREDLGAVRAELAAISTRLPELAQEAAAAVTAHLEQLIEAGTVTVETEPRVREQIARGDLASAEEVLTAADAGLELPEPVDLGLFAQFFPTVPDALVDGLTEQVITAVRDGATAAGCSYADLPGETRSLNAAALQAWRTAAHARRDHVTFNQLAAPLRLAGFEAARDTALPAVLKDAPRSTARRFIDLTGVKVVGNAVVPAFGSGLDEHLRLLLVWGPATPQSLIDWVKQDPTEQAVVICYFGTLSADARSKLAVGSTSLGGKPVVVLDDAVMAFLASRPEASVTTTMRLVLPFAAINPYVPQVEGNVPTEMFYGRTSELSSLLGRDGTSLVYGGRQLGKSALLRAAQRRHVETGAGVAVYVSTPSPDIIWDALRSSLERAGIRASGKDAKRDAHHAVVAAVEKWLADNAGKRILVLFDECDRFFDEDAKGNFAQTTKLRDLRNANDRRFKPVFAGLHEVARFASLPNQPLVHLGKPAPIGPLNPAEGFRLVSEPLAALGIRFDEEWAAWRVLAYCNYQPILLQLVCQQLVRYVHERRDEFTPVPYVITADEFEEVWKSPELTEDVSAKLRLTLELDPRYGVVAAVLGLARLSEEKATALSTQKLREDCEGWWPAGFGLITEDEFRALLIEMVTLGVLTQENAGWALRSENVRRMLGTRDDIEARLVRADTAEVPGPHVAAKARLTLAGTRVAPLTEAQLADVVGRRNQLRLVLGSDATGADLLGELLAKAESEMGTFTLLTPSTRSAFLEALSGGQRGGLHRVVFCDVTGVRDETIRDELEMATSRLPADGVTRSVVLHLGADMDKWLHVLDAARGGLVADSVVACARLDATGLERWSHSQHGQFSDGESRERLLALTGGWPVLLDAAAASVERGLPARQVLADLRSGLDADLGLRLLGATGLPGSQLQAPYAALTALGEVLDDVTDADVHHEVSSHHPHPDVVVVALVAAGALSRNVTGGLSLEPVLAAQWEAHRG